MDYLQDYIQIWAAYKALENEGLACWKLSDLETVLKYFFEQHKHFVKKPHPHLRKETYRHIIEKLFFYDYEPDDFMGKEGLIMRYFMTEFKECDYSLVHFTSGNIIAYRAIETGIEYSPYNFMESMGMI